MAIRIITIRLMPDEAQWKLLRLRASQAASYANKYAQAHLADALKWRVPEQADKDSLARHIRATARGDISSSTYCACESEVKRDWQRSARKIMAGAPLPQYRQHSSLGFATITGRAGVRINVADDGTCTAALMISGQHVEGGCWMSMPVARKTRRDEYRLPMLARMAAGDVPILMARVLFKLYQGKTLLQLTYQLPDRELAPMGERHATLSQLSDGRLVLRTDTGALLDYTSRLHHLEQLKEHWDLITRRWRAQMGKRKGHARQARRLNARLSFADKRDTAVHQWTADMVRWLGTQGCGTLTIVDPVGGDVAAHLLRQQLAYKCEEAGIRIVEPTFDDTTTEKAAQTAVRKRRARAKKLGQAVREAAYQLGEGTNGTQPGDRSDGEHRAQATAGVS